HYSIRHYIVQLLLLLLILPPPPPTLFPYTTLFRSSSRFRWIIDPIDGTTNFAHGLALFCTSIALEIDGRLEIGVVYDPISEELLDRKSTRLNSSHVSISYAVFCLKKKNR